MYFRCICKGDSHTQVAQSLVVNLSKASHLTPHTYHTDLKKFAMNGYQSHHNFNSKKSPLKKFHKPVDSVKEQIKELMGRAADDKRFGIPFTSDSVCKLFLHDCCPYGRFEGCKINISQTCSKIHDPVHIAEYQAEKDQHTLDVDAYLELKRFFAGIDYKIRDKQKFIDKQTQEYGKEKEHKQAKITKTEQLISDLKKELNEAEEAHDFVPCRELSRKLDVFTLSISRYRQDLNAVDVKLSQYEDFVCCEVCGGFISRTIADKGSSSHNSGKMHSQMVYLRSCLESLKGAYDEKRLQWAKQHPGSPLAEMRSLSQDRQENSPYHSEYSRSSPRSRSRSHSPRSSYSRDSYSNRSYRSYSSRSYYSSEGRRRYSDYSSRSYDDHSGGRDRRSESSERPPIPRRPVSPASSDHRPPSELSTKLRMLNSPDPRSSEEEIPLRNVKRFKRSEGSSLKRSEADWDDRSDVSQDSFCANIGKVKPAILKSSDAEKLSEEKITINLGSDPELFKGSLNCQKKDTSTEIDCDKKSQIENAPPTTKDMDQEPKIDTKQTKVAQNQIKKDDAKNSFIKTKNVVLKRVKVHRPTCRHYKK